MSARERTSVPVELPAGEHCIECAQRIDERVAAIPGVESVEIDRSVSELTVEHDPSVLTREQIVAEVERLGHVVQTQVAHASWRVRGLDCPDCARTVDVSVARIDNVLSATLNFASGTLFVEYEAPHDPRSAIEGMLSDMGYDAESLDPAIARPVAEFTLAGVDCPDCARSLAGQIRSLAGVHESDVDFGASRLRVGYDPALVDPATLAQAIERAGYAVVPSDTTGPAKSAPISSVKRAERATWASGVLIVIGWLIGWLLGASLLAVESQLATVLAAIPYAAAILVGGGLIFRRARSSLSARVLDMNVLMTIAVVGAAFLGEWSEAATVVFLFSIGGMLETRSLERTRSSIRGLMDLTPPLAHLATDDGPREVAPTDVAVGSTIVVRPGERVPLDGRILSGASALDESAITGESVPAEKTVGAEVFAGTLNTVGLLEIQTTAPAEETTLARVIYLVEEAQAQRAPFQGLVDRFTRYYTPIVTLVAFALAVVPPVLGALLGVDALPFDTSFSTWFYRALVLLVVGCPCALVISTPVAIVSAITRASRDGVLVKGGAFLELAPRVRALAFDKTGTLTNGQPEVADVIALDGSDAADVLARAAALEMGSTHPLARAVVRAADSATLLPVAGVIETPGRGIAGTVAGAAVAVGTPQFVLDDGEVPSHVEEVVSRLEMDGHTVLAVACAGVVVGVIGISDTARAAGPETISRLRAGGISEITMLTGDNDRVASAIAEASGLDSFHARMLPQDKVDEIRALKARWGTVAMVGDGVNDAPALAAADLGIAMGAAGSDTALETADIALMSDDLRALPRFFDLSRRTVANIRQNVIVSIVLKFAVLIAAVFGYAPLWLAVFADTGVALLVILNGLRLLRAR